MQEIVRESKRSEEIIGGLGARMKEIARTSGSQKFALTLVYAFMYNGRITYNGRIWLRVFHAG